MKRVVLFLTCSLVATVCARSQTQPAEPQPSEPQPSGWQAAVKSVTEACKGETPQLCPGMSADTAVACLQSNIDKLTPGCKNAVTEAAKSALGLLK